MTSQTAPVAVIMSVRNGEPYLAAAIDSILDQTRPPDEVIVVDDGSEDGTATTLARYGAAIRVLRQGQVGQFVAMNRGIEAARAPFLAFLDADDLFTPDSIALRLERILAPDTPDAVFGRTEQFLSPELTEEEATRIVFQPGPMAGEVFQTMLIRREAFARVGPLEVGMRTSANIDWVSRSRDIGIATVRIDDLVARRRLHKTNLGFTHADEKRDNLLAVIRAHRLRARGGGGDSAA